ncbi:MAG: hypothetical protein RLY49_596 [Candidatus Parcubacteria bacterium]|jgi:uncharacterized protein (TIGR00730 family)
MLFFRKKKDIERPHKHISSQPLTLPELEAQIKKRVNNISKEILTGFDFIKDTPKTVTFFGSARTLSSEKDYQDAYELSKEIAKLGYAIVTGGGPGIMEAANKGAYEVDGNSFGLTIKLPHEQITNPYLSKEINFQYFFTRKVSLTYAAEAYIYFPGGFGTLDELFEILTLVQTNKIDRIPVILFGSYFWKPLESFIEKFLLENGKVDPQDTKLFKITDSIEEALNIVKNAPIRNAH